MKKQESQEEKETRKKKKPRKNKKPRKTQEGPKEVKGMKELVEYIAKAIVNAPDEVVVTEETDEQGTTLKLQVADDDKGRVIGKQGRVAQAMRTLIRVMAAKAGTRATLEII